MFEWPLSGRGHACVAITPPIGPHCATFSHDAWGHVTVATDNRSPRHFDVEGNLDYQVDAQEGIGPVGGLSWPDA